MSLTVLLIGYCILIVAASLAGGKLSSLLRMTHLRTQLLMSGVGGLMLGIALLHLLPHAGEVLQSHSQAGVGTLIGLTVMFLLIRLFHTHDHSVPVTENESGSESASDHEHCNMSTHTNMDTRITDTRIMRMPTQRGSVGLGSSLDCYCIHWWMESRWPVA
jgi:zinc and cadmium transporter